MQGNKEIKRIDKNGRSPFNMSKALLGTGIVVLGLIIAILNLILNVAVGTAVVWALAWMWGKTYTFLTLVKVSATLTIIGNLFFKNVGGKKD